MGKKKSLALLTTAMIALGTASVAAGQTPPRYQFDVRSKDLKFALRSVTREAGLQLFADADDLRDRRSPELHADTTVEDALRRLLAGTGLHAEISGRSVFIRGRQEAGVGSPPADAAMKDIVVTGSHIAEEVTSSLVLVQTQRDMINDGQTDLGQVVRDIPQNFGGGQNPGIGFAVPSSSGQNLGGGSAINLRGLGQDATLTLVNGHRRAYGGTGQSVDVSAIPLAIVDRVEIVPDGASAIYGSDAVAGVANVILKRDFNGLTTSATFGATSDGGGTERLASAVGGKRWTSGGFAVAYEFGDTDPISSNDRSFAAATPNLTLMPSDKHHSVALTGHASISDHLTFSLDSLFNSRDTDRHIPLAAGAEPPIEYNPSHSDSFSVTPALGWQVTPSWDVTLDATYGFDRIHYGTSLTSGGTTLQLLRACACNSTVAAELGATGTLVRIGGHVLSLAIGGGYRKDTLDLVTTIGTRPRITGAQEDGYGYGELNIPFVVPSAQILLVHKLTMDAAGRYESYPGIGQVATPKLGLIWSPVAGVDLKSSWGKSFRAPTLYERYVSDVATLYPAAMVGGSGLPANATALLLQGGDARLKPERATTWSETVAIHPQRLSGLSLDVSYFHIRYRDRIVIPITYPTNALSDPTYRPYVTLSPDAAQIAAALAGRTLTTYGGASFNPGTIVAIIDSETANAASQQVSGVDVSTRYDAKMPRGGELALDADVSYLSSRQRYGPLDPLTTLAGTLYNPPHVRARAGARWSNRHVTLSGHLNYTGPVGDVRFDPAVGGRSMTTLDIAATYRFPERHGPLKGVRVTAKADNLFNQYPGIIANSLAYQAPYDSTNYSPVGRLLSLTISHHW